MRWTVFGGQGFIGRHLATHLAAVGHEVVVPERSAEFTPDTDLGHVIYCIGLTADFRQRPLETIDAHVHTLVRLMRAARFQSWLYLSSTRVYGGLGASGVGSERTPLPVLPSADSLYDLSKLLGEAFCLGRDDPAVRVARLANVFGPGQGTTSFLGSVIESVRRTGAVTIREDALSSKDYVAVDDVVRLIAAISLRGRERLYNVASGAATTHGTLASALGRLTGATITFQPGAARRVFPMIDNERVRQEFGFEPRRLIDELAELLNADERTIPEGRNDR